MAKKIIQAQMQQRRDTKANWASKNPVLLEGELGLVTDDKNLYKVGDGVTAWNDLPFRGFDGTLVHETGDSDSAAMSQRGVTQALAALKERMVEKVPGKGLSTEDYTTEEKEKLAELSAEVGEVSIEIYGGNAMEEVALNLNEDKYYNTDLADGNMKENPSTYANSGYYCAKLQVSEGEIYKLYGLGGSGSTRLFAFADENLFRISRSDNNIDAREEGIELVVPQGVAWLYINFKNYDEASDKLTTQTTIVGLKERVATLENAAPYLLGKNVVCFGDSLTANKDSNGKSWTDYAAEYVGANFINVAVGGAHLKYRVNIEIFNTAHSYTKLTDYVYRRDSDGIMRCYQCIATHSGEWDASHFSLSTNSSMYAGLDISSLITQSCTGDFSIATAASECILNQFGSGFSDLVTKLQGIDWAKVDAIIVWGGTNDFNATDTMRYGIVGEIDKSTTFGAINYIAETFCSTYKAIPMYYISLIPHWTDFKNGVGSPDKWGDVEYKYPIFDAAKTYAVNDKVVYVSNGIARVYRCTAVHSGEWIEGDFTDIGPAYTFKDFSALLCQEFASNHIPYKDLYNTLSWNKYNFAEYYPNNDGTHPMKGLKKISHAIASFINSCVNL